jgi:hypothetical protein
MEVAFKYWKAYRSKRESGREARRGECQYAQWSADRKKPRPLICVCGCLFSVSGEEREGKRELGKVKFLGLVPS